MTTSCDLWAGVIATVAVSKYTYIYNIGPCTISIYIYICTWATVKYKYDFHIRCIFPFPRLVVYSLIWFGCDIYRSLEPTVQWIIYFNAETDFICTSSPEPVNRPFSFFFYFFYFYFPLFISRSRIIRLYNDIHIHNFSTFSLGVLAEYSLYSAEEYYIGTLEYNI
jgi:hypothetical protein